MIIKSTGHISFVILMYIYPSWLATYRKTAAVAQWVIAFVSQAEGGCSNTSRDRPKS